MSSKDLKLSIVGGPSVGEYSLSPRMHNAALRELGLRGKYEPLGKGFEQLKTWLENEALTFDGFNVTMPYKAQVWDWIRNSALGGQVSPEADEMSAVNTVVVKDRHPMGYNTDGEGFLKPLLDRKFDMSGWKVVLMGSGGAARAIAYALARKSKVAHLTIWNRESHLLRAKHLAQAVNKIRSSEGFASATSDHQSLRLEETNLFINATPMGMLGKEEILLPFRQLPENLVVYDLVYEPRETVLITTAREKGCRVITGDEMLAAQGAAAFELFVSQPGVGAKVYPVMKKALEEHFADRF